MRTLGTILILLASLLARPAAAVPIDRTLVTSDGVRLHYIDTGLPPGRPSSPVLVFIPGWTMPGWIFTLQVQAFAPRYRVVVLDPRGQGSSDVPSSGYTYARRGEDVADLVASLAPSRVVLVGWSLGVLDSLAYVHMHGDTALAGMVLIDNSVGEDPPPVAAPPPPRRTGPHLPRQSHAAYMAGFVRGMFRHQPSREYLAALTEAALRTPEFAASALLSYAVPRSYWKEAIYDTAKPVLYLVRPALSGQAANLAAHHPAAESVVVQDLGHAMFVDDPARFDAMVQDFLTRRVRG